MLGGMKEQNCFKTFQNNINNLIQSGLGVDHEVELGYYKQLISNIIGNIPCFNVSPAPSVNPIETDEAALDLLVDKKSNDGERLIVVIQRVNQFSKSSIIVGVLLVGTKSNNRWYSLDQAVIEEIKGRINILLEIRCEEDCQNLIKSTALKFQNYFMTLTSIKESTL